jgi:hypothetical protein
MLVCSLTSLTRNVAAFMGVDQLPGATAPVNIPYSSGYEVSASSGNVADHRLAMALALV